MKLKNLSLLLLLFVQPIFATNIPKPDVCPSINAIKSLKVNNASIFEGNTWIAYRYNQYDTNQQWFFALYVQADSEEQAINIANNDIALLSVVEGPTAINNNEKEWSCTYADTNHSVWAVAITPPSTNPLAL